MTISHHTTPIILPQALDVVDTAQNFPLGTTVKTNDGGEAVYVQAASGVAQYNAVAIGDGYTVVNLTTAQATDGSGYGKEVAFAQTSIASSSYAWVQKSGRPIGKLAANCADKVILFTTSTAGTLDDATVSAAYVVGVVSKTTISNATAVTLMVPNGAHARPWSNPA